MSSEADRKSPLPTTTLESAPAVKREDTTEEAPETPAAATERSASEEETTTGAGGAQPGHSEVEEKPGSDRGLLLWIVGIVVVLAVELFIYGHNGDIQVCVGLEGVTDFGLVGEARTPENYRKFPQCASRLNLGMWTSSEEQAKAALEDACSRATVMRGPESKLECVRRDANWKMVVTKKHVPPWDSRLYRRLLWLD